MSESERLDRLPLRDLLNNVEHRCRELVEHLQMDLTPSAKELHNLTRPQRRRSAFPTLRTVYNACEKLHRGYNYAQKLAADIEDCIQAVERRAQQIRPE